MSGHNRWSKIKHKKEASDQKRSKVWTKIIREITVSARLGGGDLDGNSRLRVAVDKGRAVNIPNDTIERSIKKGIGDLDGVTYEEFAYEVYGPGGTAMLVEIMTDNRNRTAGEVRNVLTKYNGNLGASGSVAYLFKKLGVIVFDKAAVDENVLTDLAIELGADDIKSEADSVTVLTAPKELERIRAALKAEATGKDGKDGGKDGKEGKEGKEGKKARLPEPVSAEVTMVPQTLVHVSGADAEKVMKLISALEDNDDVQNVYSNVDIDDADLERLG
jgi:YebC/PmpR family DNA-binding regulatory protein